MDWLAVFFGGVLGSSHCIGMCGGFAAAIGATGMPVRTLLLRQLVYTAGRIFTYAFLGAVGGSAGLYLAQLRTPLVGVQQVFSVLAGAMMIIVGLSAAGVLHLGGRWSRGITTHIASAFARLLGAHRQRGFFVAGLLNGFLPCGLVYAFLAMAVATGDMVRGMALMTIFGLGTAPAMLAIGCGSVVLSHVARRRIYRVAACIVIVLGVVTIKRAFPPEEGCCADDNVITATDGTNG